MVGFGFIVLLRCLCSIVCIVVNCATMPDCFDRYLCQVDGFVSNKLMGENQAMEGNGEISDPKNTAS